VIRAEAKAALTEEKWVQILDSGRHVMINRGFLLVLERILMVLKEDLFED
jgi:hypothetical protein